MNKAKWKFEVIKMRHINDLRKTYFRVTSKTQIDDIKRIFHSKKEEINSTPSRSSSKVRLNSFLNKISSSKAQKHSEPLDKHLNFQSLVLNHSKIKINDAINKSTNLDEQGKKVRIRTKKKIFFQNPNTMGQNELLKSHLNYGTKNTKEEGSKDRLRKLILKNCQKSIIRREKAIHNEKNVQNPDMKKLSPWEYQNQQNDF